MFITREAWDWAVSEGRLGELKSAVIAGNTDAEEAIEQYRNDPKTAAMYSTKKRPDSLDMFLKLTGRK